MSGNKREFQLFNFKRTISTFTIGNNFNIVYISAYKIRELIYSYSDCLRTRLSFLSSLIYFITFSNFGMLCSTFYAASLDKQLDLAGNEPINLESNMD